MSTRRSAFDPSRLDDELAELLPPPAFAAAATSTTAPRFTAGAQPPAGAAGGEDGTRRPIRSAAPATARPASPGADLAVVVPAGDGATTVVAVRVPRALYESVVRDLLGALVEKPSYAQIIAWTCQDHPDEVRLELQRQVTADSRAPRGRRIASESVPLTPRFQPAELAVLDAVAAEVADGSGKVTRTAAVVAALRVAIRQGVSVSA
jgi:hypothetical protein